MANNSCSQVEYRCSVGFSTREVVEIIFNFPALSSYISTPPTSLALASVSMTYSDALSG